MQPPLSRPTPRMDPGRYKTYAVVSPLSSHFRPATCAEVDCPHWLHGWGVRITEIPPEDQAAVREATYTLNGKQYRYSYVEQEMEPGKPWLLFKPGQPCFKARWHRKRIEKEPLFLIRGGDHRTTAPGSDSGRELSAQSWVDDFGEHTQRLADEIEKG